MDPFRNEWIFTIVGGHILCREKWSFADILIKLDESYSRNSSYKIL